MADLGDVIFNGFQAGIAGSPVLGYADMRNVLIDEVPGAVTAAFLATKESGTTITALPTWAVINPATGNIYALDEDGKLYKSTDGGDSWALVSGNTLPTAGEGGQGLGIWKNYIFVARAATIDVMKISDETWTNSWQAISSDTGFHPMILTPNDKLTGGAGRYVFTITETAGQTFDPGNAGTFTFTAQALTLPTNYRIKCLEMHGLDLRIGTFIGTTLYQNKIADIFAWDRTSVSFTGEKTIRLNENGVSQLKCGDDGLLRIVAGVRNNVYISNGTQANTLKEIKSADFSNGANANPRPGAIMFHNAKLYTGLSNGAGVSPLGVYSLKSNALVLENGISTGAFTGIKIGFLLSLAADTYLIGWQTASAQGIDLVGKNALRCTGYTAYIDSALVRVGTPARKRSFTQVEFQLANALTIGTGIRLAYRKNVNEAFTTIGTYDFTTYGGVSSLVADASIADAENLQIRAFITTYDAGIVSPALMEVRLR